MATFAGELKKKPDLCLAGARRQVHVEPDRRRAERKFEFHKLQHGKCPIVESFARPGNVF
jgi:hypothetical protein